jgi:hypothetical protein
MVQALGVYMKLKAFILGSLISFNAAAGDAIVSWTYPTTYEDGSAMPVSEITEVTVYYGLTATGPYTANKVVAAPATSTTITNLGKGKWYFTATITATNGLESAQAIEVNKMVWGTSKPKPPVVR